MKKNVASQRIGAEMIAAADGSPFTGSVTAYVVGDGGTQAVGSVGSGACTHKGNGFHVYAPAQAETNYDHVAFTFIGTGAVPATLQAYPNFPQTVDNATNIANIQGRIPAALVSGRMDSSVGAMAANVMTAAAAAPDLTAELQATLATETYIDGAVAGILANTITALTNLSSLLTNVGNLPTNTQLATALGTADDAVLAVLAGLATGANLSTMQGGVTTLLTNVENLPTNAQLATALGTADDATLAAIAGLNNLSQAQVNAQADLAISDAALATASNLAAARVAIDAILADTGTDGVVISAADRGGIRKNTALANFEFVMTDAVNHNPATGLTVAATRSIDGGALVAGTLGTVNELSNGIYRISFAAADLNGNVVSLRLTATGADDLVITLLTSP
jgi:hypothetical protein